MSQTITLQKSIWVAGVLQASGATITVDDAMAGALVHAGSAVYVTDPMAGLRTAPAQYSIDKSGNTAQLGPDGKRIRQRGSSLVKSIAGKLGVTDATTYNYTSHHQMVLAAPFYAVQIGLLNANTAEITGAKAAVAVTDTWGANGSTASRDPSTSTWVNVTFGGSATATLAAGTATRPSITWSDLMDLSSIARADGGTLPILMARAMYPTVDSHNYYTHVNAGDWSGYQTEANIINGRAYRAINQATDGVTTPGNFTQTTVTNTPIAILVRYVPLAPCLTVMGVGDSIVEGAGATIKTYGDVARAIYNLSTVERPIEFCNLGWGGQTTAQYYLRALDALDSVKPDLLIYSPWTTNDGTTITSTIIGNCKTRLARVLHEADDNSTQVILATSTPSTPGGTAGADYGSTDALRTGFDTDLSRMGYEIYNRAAVLSGATDGDGQVLMTAAYTTDNLHPNDAGVAAMATALQAIL